MNIIGDTKMQAFSDSGTEWREIARLLGGTEQNGVITFEFGSHYFYFDAANRMTTQQFTDAIGERIEEIIDNNFADE